MSHRDTHLKLRPATLTGVARKQELSNVELVRRQRIWSSDLQKWVGFKYEKAGVHPTPATAKIYRVSEDAVVISDGSYGYIPFDITLLEDIVGSLRDLPILEGRVELP